VLSFSSRFRRGRTGAALALALSAALLGAGCGSSGGSLSQQDNPVDLSGQSYTVGGKQTASQQVLCEIAGGVLESVGASVQRRCNLGDDAATRQALVGGSIDMYWEETGTAWVKLLKQPPVQGMSAQYRAVQKKDAADNKIVWLEPTWFNDTDGFAINTEQAKKLKLRTLSDMFGYLKSGKPGTVCVDSAYQQNQAGGLAGLQRAYGFELKPEQQRVLKTDDIYQATAGGQDCLFGKVTTGDPQVAKQGLTLLVDDKYYHPSFNDAITIRKEVYDRNPDIARAFRPVARKLTDPVMSRLLLELSQGKSAKDVADGWLRQEGFIEG